MAASGLPCLYLFPDIIQYISNTWFAVLRVQVCVAPSYLQLKRALINTLQINHVIHTLILCVIPWLIMYLYHDQASDLHGILWNHKYRHQSMTKEFASSSYNLSPLLHSVPVLQASLYGLCVHFPSTLDNLNFGICSTCVVDSVLPTILVESCGFDWFAHDAPPVGVVRSLDAGLPFSVDNLDMRLVRSSMSDLSCTLSYSSWVPVFWACLAIFS